jgi:hypothetical protein
MDFLKVSGKVSGKFSANKFYLKNLEISKRNFIALHK